MRRNVMGLTLVCFVLIGCESAEVKERREAEAQATSLAATCASMRDLDGQMTSARALAGEPKRKAKVGTFADTACEMADKADAKARKLQSASTR